MKKRFYSIAFVCTSFILLMAGAACAQEQQQPGGLSAAPRQQPSQTPPPSQAPADVRIRLTGADGKTYDVAEMRGQVVLVSFGATWCQPCNDELRALEQLKKEYKDKPVRFLWVSIESEEEISDSGLRDYAKRLKLSFPVLRDPERATFTKFSTRVRLPMIVFFDREGKISTPNHVGMGAIPLYMSTMRGRLDKLLAMRPSDNAAGR
ncbi:MAG TPA: TlpA disulfide reductase family protein [Pyrinomonadaceae bacterium]|jgi:peroxiredoxin